jgi:hypothetical protein
MRFVPLAALASVAFLFIGRLVYPMSLRMARGARVPCSSRG